MKHAVLVIDIQNALVNSTPEPFEIGVVMPPNFVLIPQFEGPPR